MVGYRVCSWDVGIKHLAYCVLEKTDSEPVIIDWGVVNVVEDETHYCEQTNKKTGKPCDKKATSYGYHDDGNVHNYCGTHKSDYPGCPFDWEDKNVQQLVKDTDQTCTHQIKNKNCDKKGKAVVEGKVFCTVHQKQYIRNVKKQYTLVPIKKKNCYTSDPQYLAVQMYKKLDRIKTLLEVNEVLIENQPSLKNPTMKTVASFLFGYFAMRGVVDGQQDTTIKFFSPSNKLKLDSQNVQKLIDAISSEERVYRLIVQLVEKHWGLSKAVVDTNKSKLVGLVVRCLVDKSTYERLDTLQIDFLDSQKIPILVKKIEKDTKNYEITKLLSIKYTHVLVRDNQPQWLELFDSWKKKDDPCDAYLQGRKHLLS